MTIMPPSPFCSAGAPHDAPPAETLPAAVSGTEHLAAGSDRFVLDEEKFMFDIGFVPDNFEKYMAMLDQLADDPPPLFLQRTG
jgi:hypothetical protein